MKRFMNGLPLKLTCHIVKKEFIFISVLSVFICSFLLLAPLFGYLGDRYNRKYIMIGGLTVWLATAAGSSFVTVSVSEKVFTHCEALKTRNKK